MHCERTIHLNLAENQIKIEYDVVRIPHTVSVSVPTFEQVLSNFCATLYPSRGREKLRVDVALSVGDEHTPVGHLQGETFIYTAQQGLRLTFSLDAVSLFESAFVIASNLEMAAVTSSVFHDVDRYVPVVFFDEPRVSPKMQRSIWTTFQWTQSQFYIFAGIASSAIEDFLWDKSTTFRTRCKVYNSTVSTVALELPFM